MGARIFFLGITSGLLAAVAAFVFQRVHHFATYADFSGIVTIPVLLAVNLGVCMIASYVFWALLHWLGRTGEIIFNILFVIASFASITWSFAVTLPLNIEFPELFPGLTVPMHFFPALLWFACKPLFISNQKSK